MKGHVAACHCLPNRCRIAQIADNPIRIQSVDISQIAAGTNQESQVSALLGQCSGHVTAHESGCASDESQHLAIGN